MASGEPCGVCGETETKLVDGYYYCAECGTQDTNLQETIVEYQLLADGTVAIGRRTRYSVKIKDGVEMSPEWYKWHKNNFLLAGLTEQLVELGAAPSVRMKVLWIWTRYIKLFQKKGEMGPKQAINQLENSSSSEDEKKDLEEEEEGGEEDMAALARKGVLKLDRVSGYVLVAILALGLNIDRSPVLMSHVTRWARLRLLSVADVFRLVPAEVLARCGRLGYSPARAYHAIPVVMARMTKLLSLGGPVAPDVEALLASQLRELRLPRALAALVRALVRLAPAPAHSHRRADEKSRDESRFPDYEATVMAYVVVALKLCFGLDDERERRLADAVQRVNQEARHPRAYGSAPAPTARLFSFRAWARQLRLRARTLARTFAPAGWARAEHAAAAGRAAHAHVAALAQLQEFTSARAVRPAGAPGARKGAKARVTDQVTMEILNRIPARFDAGAPSLAELRTAAAAREPQVALARAAGRRLSPARARLLDEDFTEYDIEYAFRRLSLPGLRGDHLFRGVRPRVCAGPRVGDRVYNSVADPSTVYVKNCGNRHWARTGRPAAAHVGPAPGSGSGDSGGEPGPEPGPGPGPGTFVEEEEGRCIFDDDFSDIAIKEEKPDVEDDVRGSVDDTKDVTNWIDSFANFETENKSDDEVPDIFDSDDEVGPRFDPSTFRRREVIEEMMAASYKRLVVRPPIRFQTEKNLDRKRKYKPEYKTREHRFGVDTQVWANKLRAREARAAVEGLVAVYRDSLRRGGLHHAAAADAQPDHPPPPPQPEPEPEPGPALADPGDADDGAVEIIEEDEKDDNNDDDSSEEHAYDPILKSDAKFDENAHDIDQLYLKMTAPPPEDSCELFDDDVVAILDERIRRRNIPKGKKKEKKVMNTDIDHLVDEPDRITAFRYWFAQPQRSKTQCFIRQRRKFEREIREWSPRSFWFVLTECAAAVDLWPARLYARVVAVEAELLKLLPERDGPRRTRGRPRKDEGPEARVFDRNRARVRVDVDDDLSVAGDSRDGKASSEDDSNLSEHREKLTKAGNPCEGKRGTGRREKSGEPMVGNISEASDSEDASSSEDQNYRRPEEKGKPRKHISKTSDSSDTAEGRPETSNSEAETSFSEDTERPKKSVKSRKFMDGGFSKARASRNWGRIRSLKSSEEDTDSSEVEKEPREKSRKTVEDCFSDSSHARERRQDRPSTGSERDTSSSDDQEEPRKKGRPRKNKNGDVLEESDLRHQTDLSKPKKRGRPLKYQEHTSEASVSEKNALEKSSKCSNTSLREDSDTLQNQQHRKKIGRPRKNEDLERKSPSTSVDGSSSEASDSRWRPESKYFESILQEDASILENSERPRTRGRLSKSVDDSHAEDASIIQTLTDDDGITQQNQEQPRKRGRPRKYLGSSFQRESNSQSHEHPRKRGRPRKYLDSSLQRGSNSQSHELPRKRGRPRKYLDSSLQRGSNSQSHEHPRKRGRPRKYLDSSLQRGSNSQSHELPRKRGRPRKYLDSSLQRGSNSQSHEHPRKRGRPRKYLDSSLQRGSNSQSHEHPRKRGRPRKYLDSSLQRGSNSQSHEHPRKRGRPRKDEDPRRKRENIPKEANRNVSEEISRLNTPERPSTCLDSHEEDEINSQNKWKSGRKSVDDLGDLSETSDSKDVRSEKSNKYLDEDTSTSESSENQEPSRKRGRPHKFLDQNLPESNYKHYSTRKISSPTSAKTLQEDCVILHNTEKKRDQSHQDAEENLPGAGVAQKRADRPSLDLESKLQTDSSTSPRQNVSKTRERPLKSVDGNLPKAREPRERNSREARVLHKTIPKKSSSYFDWRHLDNASTPQNQEQQKKRKFAPGEVSDANVFKKVPGTQSTSTSRLQDGRCSSGDPAKRRRGRPSKYVDWRLLQNASTPQSREQPWKREALGKHVQSFPGDLSAIQTLPQGASVSQNDTTEEPLLTESRIIRFDKF